MSRSNLLAYERSVIDAKGKYGQYERPVYLAPGAAPKTLSDFVHSSDAERKKIGAVVAAETDKMMAPKPLTDEQIYEMYSEPRSDAEMVAFARAIEAAHGIKGAV